MSMKKLALAVGLFSLVIGWLTYDREVSTAPVPIITGLIVMVLAVCNLIPEFVICPNCGRKNINSRPHCAHCRAELTPPADKPAD